MCARPASRLLWCARLSERGVVQHWGSKSWQWHVRASVSSGVGVWSKCSSGSGTCICTCICIIRCICMCICLFTCANTKSGAQIQMQIRFPSLYLQANTQPKPVFACKNCKYTRALFCIYTCIYIAPIHLQIRPPVCTQCARSRRGCEPALKPKTESDPHLTGAGAVNYS